MIVEQQKKVIEKLAQGGHETNVATSLLHAMERGLEAFEQHRETIIEMLKTLRPYKPPRTVTGSKATFAAAVKRRPNAKITLRRGADDRREDLAAGQIDLYPRWRLDHEKARSTRDYRWRRVVSCGALLASMVAKECGAVA